jgi:hypothetical protein
MKNHGNFYYPNLIRGCYYVRFWLFELYRVSPKQREHPVWRIEIHQSIVSLHIIFQGTLSIYPLPEDRDVPVPPRIFTDDRLPKAKPVNCIVRVYIVRVRLKISYFLIRNTITVHLLKHILNHWPNNPTSCMENSKELKQIRKIYFPTARVINIPTQHCFSSFIFFLLPRVFCFFHFCLCSISVLCMSYRYLINSKEIFGSKIKALNPRCRVF